MFIPLSVFAFELNLEYPFVDINVRMADGIGVSELVLWLYYMIITIATAAAFGVIVWGGFEYLTSAGNPGRMQTGVNRIQDAVIGLLIILVSYLVLQSISPQLVRLDFTFSRLDTIAEPTISPPMIFEYDEESCGGYRFRVAGPQDISKEPCEDVCFLHETCVSIGTDGGGSNRKHIWTDRDGKSVEIEGGNCELFYRYAEMTTGARSVITNCLCMFPEPPCPEEEEENGETTEEVN